MSLAPTSGSSGRTARSKSCLASSSCLLSLSITQTTWSTAPLCPAVSREASSGRVNGSPIDGSPAAPPRRFTSRPKVSARADRTLCVGSPCLPLRYLEIVEKVMSWPRFCASRSMSREDQLFWLAWLSSSDSLLTEATFRFKYRIKQVFELPRLATKNSRVVYFAPNSLGKHAHQGLLRMATPCSGDSTSHYRKG